MSTKVAKNKSKTFFILFSIFLIITIICTILMINQKTDTTVNLDRNLDLNKYKSMAKVYKSNNNTEKYEETMMEIDKIESEMEKEKTTNTIISYSPFVSGGISIILLTIAIKTKSKEKEIS